MKNFYFSSCRDDGVTRRTTGVRLFRLKMIVNNVAVTSVYALWSHNNVFRACSSALNYYTMVYKYIFERKYRYTSVLCLKCLYR